MAVSPIETSCCCFEMKINLKNVVFRAFCGESINLHNTGNHFCVKSFSLFSVEGPRAVACTGAALPC